MLHINGILLTIEIGQSSDNLGVTSKIHLFDLYFSAEGPQNIIIQAT